ncbi:MAG: signal peptidase II [Dehalococcoidia bacterium]|nr:signal peptidase II [Dehalococcoidia bacterium]
MFAKISRHALYFFLIATVVVIADQATKNIVKNTIQLYSSWPETGFFRITHFQNTGAAFSILQDSRILLCIISSVGALAVAFIALYFSRRFVFLRWRSSVLALGLMLGGTLGNWIDRVFIGYVTDFISVWIWPNFNIADSALVVGCILLSFNLFRASGAEQSRESISTTDG